MRNDCVIFNEVLDFLEDKNYTIDELKVVLKIIEYKLRG